MGEGTQVWITWHGSNFASIYDRMGDFACATTATEIHRAIAAGTIVVLGEAR